MPQPRKTKTPDPPACPDAVVEQFLASSKLALEACWAVSDCGNTRDLQNPKMHIGEALQCLQKALVAAISADGADAVIGYSLVAQSIARKAHHMRQMGAFVGDDRRPEMDADQLPPGFQFLLGGPQ